MKGKVRKKDNGLERERGRERERERERKRERERERDREREGEREGERENRTGETERNIYNALPWNFVSL